MYDFSSENVGSLDTKHYDWGWKQGHDCFEHYEGDQDRVKILCVQYWECKQKNLEKNPRRTCECKRGPKIVPYTWNYD